MMLEECLASGSIIIQTSGQNIQQDSGYGGEAIHNMTRWDWGQDLFEWFEYYLKGVGPKPDNHAQIQRNDGQWRIEELWPPQDATWETIDLADCTQQGSNVGGVSVIGGEIQSVTITCDGFNQDMHIAGLPTLHLDVTASFDGGRFLQNYKMLKPD